MTVTQDSTQADRDARHTAAGLGRLLRWTTRLILAVILAWIFATDTAAMTAWHWAAAIAATPLALIAMPLPRQENRP